MDSTLLNITIECENAIFTMAMHPSKNQMLVGFSTGHICCLEYNVSRENKIKMVFTKIGKEFQYELFNENEEEIDTNEISKHVNLLWKTKRHEKSCRNVVYVDETTAVSVGSDNHMKLFKSETGKILDKYHFEELDKIGVKPNCLYAFNEYILMGTEEKGIVKVMKYDADNDYKLEMFNTIEGLHNGDSINKIESLNKNNYKKVIKKTGKSKIQDEFITEALSVHKFVSAGQTSIQIWDCRWKDISKVQSSEDQEDELLTICYLNDDENDTTMFCGQGQGVLTTWKYGLNEYQDQIGRIKIARNEGIETLIPTMLNNNRVWCGVTDGFVYLIDGKVKRIVKKVHHGKYEDVSLLDIDYEYKLVSGSMNAIKLWEIDQGEEEEPEIMSEDSSDEDFSDDSVSSVDPENDILSGEEEESDDNSDDEAIASFKKAMEEKPRKIEVQEIKMSNKDINKISKKQQKKKQQELKRKQESLKHGIRKFEGL